MRNAHLPRLALRGLYGSRKLYLPFVLTTSFMVLVYFVIASFVYNPSFAQHIPNGGNILLLMSVGYFLMPVVLVPLLLYIYSYLLKNRSRELALYAILGLERRHIAVILLIENSLCFAVCVLLGIGAGVLLCPLVFSGLLAALGQPAGLMWTFSINAALGVAKVFAVCFAGLVVMGVWRAAHTQPASLLREQMQGEKPMRSRLPVALLGAVCLIAAYTLSATSGSGATLTSFMIALLLVILGTYGVFTSVSAEVLLRIRRGARFYANPSIFVIVSGLQHRMRKNAAGLTNICLFSCAALFTLCCSFSVLFGQQTVIRQAGQSLPAGQVGLNTAAVGAEEISLMFITLAFLGVFFVLVFLACTALILYYKQLTEGMEDAARFRILRAVGLSEPLAARTAQKQLGVMFLLPLGGTLLHIAFAFPFFSTFMGLISISSPAVLIGSTAAAMLIFCAFYLFCYKVTTRAYLRAIA
nr:FtsX-like permease family protein [uncultured Agathobaculum sp.]